MMNDDDDDAVMVVNLLWRRNEFDDDRTPPLNDDIHVRDIHCVSSLLKLYFRELPNPLLTYQLYDKFVVSFIYIAFFLKLFIPGHIITAIVVLGISSKKL